MNVTRDQVRSAPAWDPLAMADEVSEDALHRHFGWPGYGSLGGRLKILARAARPCSSLGPDARARLVNRAASRCA